jgi:hypothetical protein
MAELLDVIPNWDPNWPEAKPDKTTTDFSLIIDLDETAVRTYKSQEALANLPIFSDSKFIALRRRAYKTTINDPDNTKVVHDIWGVTRPHLREFLAFSTIYFKHIFVWSSAPPRYVSQIVDFIFASLPRHYVLTQKDCGHDENGQFFKPLSTIIAKYPNLGLKMEMMLMIDDLLPNMSRNVDNGIHIRKYKPEPNLKELAEDDLSLLVIKEWLLQYSVISSTNLQKIEKPQTFTREELEKQIKRREARAIKAMMKAGAKSPARDEAKPVAIEVPQTALPVVTNGNGSKLPK